MNAKLTLSAWYHSWCSWLSWSESGCHSCNYSFCCCELCCGGSGGGCAFWCGDGCGFHFLEASIHFQRLNLSLVIISGLGGYNYNLLSDNTEASNDSALLISLNKDLLEKKEGCRQHENEYIDVNVS